MIACRLALLGLLAGLGGMNAEGRSTMKLELEMPRVRYLTGESIPVDVKLSNLGSKAVASPGLASPDSAQPVYTLTGPAYPQGTAITFRDRRSTAKPQTVAVDAGGTLEAGFDVASMRNLSLAGSYTLSARIEWDGWSAQAAPVQFTVEKAVYLSASLGVDSYSESSKSLRAVWLADTPSGRVLGETFIYEKRPDLGEVHSTGTRVITAVGPTASQPFCPWTNFNRMAASGAWHGWKEGTRLQAIALGASAPQTFELGSDRAQIILPALLTAQGTMDVLTMDALHRKLQLVRFMPALDGAAGRPPQVVWSVEVPEPVLAARVAMAPERDGGASMALLVTQTRDGIGFRSLSFDRSGPALGKLAVLDGATLAKATQPALKVGGDGTAQAAVVLAADPASRQLRMVDLSYSAKGQAPVITLSVLGPASSPVVSTAAAFASDRYTETGRTWFASLADGRVVGGDTAMRPIDGASRASLSDVLRTSGASYVLTLDPLNGPKLVASGF